MKHPNGGFMEYNGEEVMLYPYFHNIPPAYHEAIVILSEECGETVLANSKALRHGLYSKHPDSPEGPCNLDSMEREAGDILAAILVMKRLGLFSDVRLMDNVNKKLQKLKKYVHHIPLNMLEKEGG